MGNSVDVLRVVDALNEEMTIIINVGAGVSITPASASAMSGQTLTFVASGGSGTAYSWSFPLGGNKSGAELNDGGQGEFYTAGPTFGVTDKIQVVDSFGNTATATVTVTPGPRPDAGPGVDAGTTDAGGDAGPVDAGEVDAGEVDAGEPDSGSDAGPGVSDAGPADGGGNEVDAGDAGETDAGDAGEVDAGDAGEVDAGDACEVDGSNASTRRRCGIRQEQERWLLLQRHGLRRRRTDGGGALHGRSGYYASAQVRARSEALRRLRASPLTASGSAAAGDDRAPRRSDLSANVPLTAGRLLVSPKGRNNARVPFARVALAPHVPECTRAFVIDTRSCRSIPPLLS
jgi:hypothetical protein